MQPSITTDPATTTTVRTAILTLTQPGLALARRLRSSAAETTVILGPSCVVGVCGGPAPGAEATAGQTANPPVPSTFPTGEPGVFGWTGALRRVLPAVWERFDAIIAIMPLAHAVRLVGPLAGDKRHDPRVVVVDEDGRFAVSVLGGHGPGADNLTCQVAAILGATPVVTARTGDRLTPSPRRVRRG